MLLNAEQLNELIFTVIQELGERATFTQIRRHFERNHLPRTARTGERFNPKYLQLLVNQFYLSRGANNVFSLEVDADDFLNELKLQREQAEQERIEDEFKQSFDEEIKLVECQSCQALNHITERRCFSCQEKL